MLYLAQQAAPLLDLTPGFAVGQTQFMNIVQQGMVLIVPIFVAVVGVAVVMKLVNSVLGKDRG